MSTSPRPATPRQSDALFPLFGLFIFALIMTLIARFERFWRFFIALGCSAALTVGLVRDHGRCLHHCVGLVPN